MIYKIKSGMLEVGTGNEIILHPCSDTDLKLKGHITLNNPYSNIFIPFKVPPFLSRLNPLMSPAFRSILQKGCLFPIKLSKLPLSPINKLILNMQEYYLKNTSFLLNMQL